MFTSGYITRGLKGIVTNPLEKRIFLYRSGKNMPEKTGCWSADDYSIFNGKTIQAGSNLRIVGSIMTISSPGNGSPTCVLLGTGIAVPVLQKRYLVVEAIISDRTAAENYKIILSKTKEITDDSSTVFYAFSFQETTLKYYIDLNELSGFTKAYIAIAGGATANWTKGSVNLQIKNIYLTDNRFDSIVPLYNRGNDYSNYSEGMDADYLIGWEGYPASASMVPGTLETGYMMLESTADKASGVLMTRSFDIGKCSNIKIKYEITELPETGTKELVTHILAESGSNLHDITETLTNTGTFTKNITYNAAKNGLRLKNKIGITASAGVKAKIIAVWFEQ